MMRRWLLFGILITIAGAAQAQEVPRLWVDPLLPTGFAVTGDYEIVSDSAVADVQITYSTDSTASRWVYVPVMAFPIAADAVSLVDIQAYWQGDTGALSSLSFFGRPVPLILTERSRAAMIALLGEPATSVEIVAEHDLVNRLWEARPALSIVPFDELSPDLKVLKLDDNDVFGSAFDPELYPLTVAIGVSGEAIGLDWPTINRDPVQLSRVVLSGVTALTRVTAYYMEELGVTRPGDDILPFLADADLFHTSNEVSFAEECPAPVRNWALPNFCSDDRYFELLTYIGVDVVEATGNHINDYGPANFVRTLEMYDAAGMQYFGGGRTPEEARVPLIMTHNGNSIAFIGCNRPGPVRAWVSDEQAGAAQCDPDYLEAQLSLLHTTVDVVIMTVQDFEQNTYEAPPAQVERFRTYATWGADVVVGTQAHKPQGFVFLPRANERPSFIHNGLGNLFFDQIQDIGTRQLFMDRLIIYDGELISVELFTGIIDNYCCPRPMYPGERLNFLRTMFMASGW